MNTGRRSDLRMKIARGFFMAALGWGLAAPATVRAQEFDGPRFQPGMWAFERTIEHVGPSSRLPNATFASRQEMLRCVDPTEAMKETFKSSSVGDCHSVKPEKLGNQFVFSLRCDFTGPVRTVIKVDSESGYIETNEAAAGKFLKRETVIAHRVGDCGAPAADYELASAESRKVTLSPLPPLPPLPPTTVVSTGQTTRRK